MSSAVGGNTITRSHTTPDDRRNNSSIPNPFYTTRSGRSTSQIPSAFGSQNGTVSDNGTKEMKRRNSSGSNIPALMYNAIAKQESEMPKKKRSRSTVAGGKLEGGRGTEFRLSQRRSLQPSSNTSPDFLSSQPHATNRDPRPLRDKNFQNAIQQEIFDYLLQNKFDIETNHPISLKSLKQPTQKGFIVIFKWLYVRLDQGYVFTRSVEYEIYQILKNLQYPYIETINKSQISAVGGTSWHKFLGMLHWMVRVNIKLDDISNQFSQSLLNQPTQEMIVVNKPIKTLDEQYQIQEKYELMVENLFIDYITESYKMFLKSDDNYEACMEKLQIGFEKFTHIIKTDVANIQAQNDNIFKQYQTFLEENKKLKVTKEKYNALQGDLKKFQTYINTMSVKSQEWPKKLEKMKNESNAKREEITLIETEIRNILASIDEMKISIEEIEEKNKDKEALIDSLDQISDKIDKLTALIKTKKFENNGVFKNLVNVLKQYNSTLETIFNERLSLSGLDIPNRGRFEIDILESLSNIDEKTPITYQMLMKDKNISIKDTITSHILELCQTIQKNIELLKIENSNIENDIIDLKNEINERNAGNEKLEDELLELKSFYDITKQKNQNTLVSEQIEIEKLERKNMDSRKTVESRINDAKQKINSRKRKLQDLKSNIHKKRSSLERKVIEIIEFATGFKSNIQETIETTKESLTNQIGNFDNN